MPGSGNGKKHKGYVHLISLGCDKNLADSEKVLAMMLEAGYRYTDDPYRADIIVGKKIFNINYLGIIQ